MLVRYEYQFDDPIAEDDHYTVTRSLTVRHPGDAAFVATFRVRARYFIDLNDNGSYDAGDLEPSSVGPYLELTCSRLAPTDPPTNTPVRTPTPTQENAPRIQGFMVTCFHEGGRNFFVLTWDAAPAPNVGTLIYRFTDFGQLISDEPAGTTRYEYDIVGNAGTSYPFYGSVIYFVDFNGDGALQSPAEPSEESLSVFRDCTPMEATPTPTITDTPVPTATETPTPTITPTVTQTQTSTPTQTTTPTPTPVPEIILELLDSDNALLLEMSPGMYMIVQGSPVTARVTFRNFQGSNRFNIVMSRADTAALKAAECYGTGMLSVRTFNSSGADVVETGSILATCPTGEYNVIVNQADGESTRGDSTRGDSPPKVKATKNPRQSAPVLTANVVPGTRTVALSVTGAEYDKFVYRFVGNGVTGTWLLLMDSVHASPVYGNAVTIEVRGCEEVDGYCPYDGPISSAQLTLPDPADASDEPVLNPLFSHPPGSYALTVSWTAPPDAYRWDGYDYFLWDVERKGAGRHAGLIRRNNALPPNSHITLGGLEPASYYLFCVRAYQNDVFGATEYQCVDGFTAPDAGQRLPPINVRFQTCENNQVVVVWEPPADAPDNPPLVRFDYIWAGDRYDTGMKAALPSILFYSATTDIYEAGDAVEFSVRAVYRVGTAADGYSEYVSAATEVSGDPCTVPSLTDPTADLWLMLNGVRRDVGIVVPVNTEVDLLWRTSGANNGASLTLNGTTELSTALNNLVGLSQDSSTGVTNSYELEALNTDENSATDSISITWEAAETPVWDRTVMVILLIKAIDPPTVKANCGNGFLTANWTIDIAAGLTLTGFRYTIIFEEVDEIGEITGVFGPEIRSAAVRGSAETITFVLVAIYTGTDGTTGLESPSARDSCGLPGDPTNLTLDCVPGVGSAAVATVRWTPPVGVTGIDFVHYEFIWLLDDESMSRTVLGTDSTVRELTSDDGDYVQGDTARFALTAFFTDTTADPDASVNSSTLTANAFCTLATATPTVTPTPILEIPPPVEGLMIECPPQTVSGQVLVSVSWTASSTTFMQAISTPVLDLIGYQIMGTIGPVAVDTTVGVVTSHTMLATNVPAEGITVRLRIRSIYRDPGDVAAVQVHGEWSDFVALDCLPPTPVPPDPDTPVPTPTDTAVPTPTPTDTPVPTPTNTPVPGFPPPVEGLMIMCPPQDADGTVMVNVSWIAASPTFMQSPGAPDLDLIGYQIMGTIGSVSIDRSVGVSTNYTMLVTNVPPGGITVRLRIRSIYMDPGDVAAGPVYGAWSDYVELDCLPPTPVPTPTNTSVPTPTQTPTPTPTPTDTGGGGGPAPILPLIEPQLAYFYPTLPPTLWQHERFSAEIQTHHVVLVISIPTGHVAINTNCPNQENIRLANNGELLSFTGCNLVNENAPTEKGTMEAQILVIWPKDGRTVLFQHWIEVNQRNTNP